MPGRKKRRNGRNGTCPRRGRRYTVAEIEEILEEADRTTVAAAAERYGCSERSISRWRTARGRVGTKDAEAAGETAEDIGAEVMVDDDGAEALSPGVTVVPARQTPSQDRVRRLVLEIKGDNLAYGPAQVQAYLRRFHGLQVTVKLIRRLLVEAGYELQKRKAKEPEATERFEMVRPNQLWQIDIMAFRIIEQHAYLLHALDDHARFSVGHALLTSVTAKDVIALVGEAMNRYGKPEAILSDRGPQFSAFRGMTAFEKWLETNVIDHVKARAYHPQTVGKLEALNSTLREEVLDQHEFHTIAESREHLDQWFVRYNHGRPHLALGGLVPADRYFGREAEVRERIARAIAAGGRDLRNEGMSADRFGALDCVLLQLRLIKGQLELCFAGKRVRLG